MDHLRRGNKQLIKDINRSLVIDQIRTKGPLSRTDIAKHTRLGLSTVTKIVDALIEQRLVFEAGEGDSSGGRRPIYVGFNHDYGYIIGVKIEKEQVILAATNLKPAVRDKIKLPFPAGTAAGVVLEVIACGISTIKERQDHPCLGIGIGVSGLVDKETGELLYSSLLGWGRTPLRAALQERFDLPVLVDNDVNAYTLAELSYGYGREIKNVILVTIGVGVGAGLVLNAQLYRGEFGGAGEVGHTVLYPDGNACFCGRKGCLETYVGDAFVLAETKRLLTQDKDSVLYDKRLTLGIGDVIEAARGGDSAARQALARAGRNLGIGLVNLVNTLNPAAVILAGEGMAGREFILPGVEDALRGNYFDGHQPPVRLLVSQLGDDAWEIGAAAMVLSELFQAPIYRKRRDVKLIG